MSTTAFPTSSGQKCSSALIGRALVVDDSAIIRKVHSKMLERLGFDVVSVDNGLQALNASAQNSFDVVLMDCEMPVMDGLTATLALRTLERTSQKKSTIVGVSASGLRNECAEAGMNIFLPKPLHVDSLAQALQSLLPKIRLGSRCPDEQLGAA